MSRGQMLQSYAAELRKTIVGKNRELVTYYDPVECIELLDQDPPERPYHHLSESVLIRWASISEQFGEDGFEAFQKIVLLQLIEDFPIRAGHVRLTKDIEECYARSYSRILSSIQDSRQTQYRSHNDILLKDLALCRRIMFPAGARLVQPNSGFHRSLMFKSGLSQCIRMVKVLFETGANTNWFQIHTHLSELDEFNPKGWIRCLRRISQMLEINPECRGLLGGSWFYDPAIESISPRLSYLRKIPESNGAYLFFSNVDTDSGALVKSKTRQALHAHGKYTPKVYTLIWPRRKLIEWGRRQHS